MPVLASESHALGRCPLASTQEDQAAPPRVRRAWLVAASLLTATLLPIAAGMASSAADAGEGPEVPAPTLPGARSATISLASLALTQNVTAPSPSSILEIQYDPVSDQLSIRADRTSLQAVLQEISQIARVSIDAPKEQLLSEELSIEMKDLSVEQALRQLLQEFNSAFLYSPAIDPQRETTPLRLVKVILLSRKASGPTVERQSGTDPRPAVGPGAALLRAVIDNDSLSAKALVQALREPAEDKEREKAVGALLETLSDKNFPSHYDAIAALHQLAPEKAVAVLANLLLGDDQEMRVIAATGLGQMGDERAIHPLMSALTGDDPLTRQVAANSIARIGGQGATDALFQTYLAGDQGLKQAVAGAVAFQADEKSQQALALVIAGGPVPAGTTAQDVIAGTLSRREAHGGDNEDSGPE
jgi:hypothetical protein